MINCKKFYNVLTENKIDFFTGIPDSLLKSFCAYIADNTVPEKNIISANEGGAIALAAGYHLATGKIGLVYMQNSGLGNATNPLISLADKEVYSIPMLLLIGWRGEPGMKDEPQHIKQGKITADILKVLGIPYKVLPQSDIKAKEAVQEAIKYIKLQSAPYALVVKKDTFDHYELKNKQLKSVYELSREDAIKTIVDNLGKKEAVVSTTGMISRELFEYREKLKQGHGNDFLTVGSMGHSSSIALGIALSKPHRQVFCLDGDGALIMHMGSLATIGSSAPANFKHIILNNGAHDSVGGQKTAGFSISVFDIAKACGYGKVFQAKTKDDLKRKLLLLRRVRGPALLEVRVKRGSRENLGRPTNTPVENKKLFTDFLARKEFSAIANRLKKFLVKNRTKNIFLVTGKKSYALSGAEAAFGKLLSEYNLTRFSDFSPNPNIKDLKKGIGLFRRGNYDMVVAIGGGSAIDMAKLINIFSVQEDNPARYIKGEKKINKKGKPLVAIPTTSGSGSEATHFAVVYINEKKYSVTHKYLLPDYSIVNPVFTLGLPKSVTASTGMDALCQALESYWSVNSTEVSKEYSGRAIKLAINNLADAVKTSSLKSKQAMSQAAHLAGKAINITKTTAPHAISYVLTSHFGIPHGHAVGLTTGKVLRHNADVMEKDVADKRGTGYVKKTMGELCFLLGTHSAVSADKKLEKLMIETGLKTRLKDLGVKKGDLNLIAENINLERLKNNPRIITEKELREILKSVL